MFLTTATGYKDSLKQGEFIEIIIFEWINSVQIVSGNVRLSILFYMLFRVEIEDLRNFLMFKWYVPTPGGRAAPLVFTTRIVVMDDSPYCNWMAKFLTSADASTRAVISIRDSEFGTPVARCLVSCMDLEYKYK